MANDKYEEILAGTVALGYLDCTLLEYARGIKYYIDQEARKPNGDTHLVKMLCRAACVGWENIKLFKASSTEPLSPSDAEQLSELRRTATVALKWMDWWLDSELCECDSYGHVCGKTERRKEANELRAVLNPKQPGKETQGNSNED